MRQRRRLRQEVDFLVVTQYFPPERGAAQVRLGALCRHLREAGHSVEVVTALPSYPTARTFPGWRRLPVQSAVTDGVRVVRVWAWPAVGSGAGRIANYASFGLMSLLGLARARRARWTVVEYPTLFGALGPVVWTRARGGRVALNVADLWVDVIAESGAVRSRVVLGAMRRLERWVLCRCHAVTVVTEGLREAVLAKGVAPDRICWLPNGVDTSLFTPSSAGGDDEGPALVLYAGTHGYAHGLEVVLGAAALLTDRPVRFLLVGGGSEKPALMAASRDQGLDNVEFRDPVAPEEVARLLGRARIGLASVRGEAIFGSVRSAKVFPVMASGVPVVYSGDDEGSALVTRAGAGVAARPGDPAALADAIAGVLDDPAGAETMGRAGRAWVEAHSGWDRLVSDWVSQLDALVGSRPAVGRPRPETPSGDREGSEVAEVVQPVFGFVGIHAGRRTGQVISQNETLAALFESAGLRVRLTSAVRRPSLRTAHQIVSLLRWRGDVDVVVLAVFSGPSFWIADFASLLSRWNGSRIVMFLHGGALGQYGPDHRRRVSRVLDRADLILAPSEFLACEFRLWGYDVRCIPNVLAIERYDHRYRDRARPRLMWMRTFHDHYHPEMAVEVLDRVVRHHPDATMTMAGADRGLLEPVRELARSRGLEDRITFPGYLDPEAKRRAFAEHDIFLNTNRVDNMPVSILEAAASGLVPVATAVGGIPDLLTDDVDALLVPDGDVEAMADAVRGLLADPERYARIGVRARALAEQSSWPAVRLRWREELRPLLSAAEVP